MVEDLTTADAKARLKRFGLNSVPEEKPQPILSLLKKLWGPVPWMLEFSVALELIIGRYTQATIIGLLLFFNAAISYLQESRAQSALALLRSRLAVRVTVRRDGVWQTLLAEELFPDDVVHLKTGNLIPADVLLLQGSLSVDQSALTGESLPTDVDVDQVACAGGIITYGEARVTATGAHTFFGKTAELVRTAQTKSHLEGTILGIVRYLVALDVFLVAAVLVYSWLHGISYADLIPAALDPRRSDSSEQVERLAQQGNRVIGIAAAEPESYNFPGLMGLMLLRMISSRWLWQLLGCCSLSAWWDCCLRS